MPELNEDDNSNSSSTIVSQEQAEAIISSLTSSTTSKPTSAPTEPKKSSSTVSKLESFIQACQQGQSIPWALKSSGLIGPDNTAEYIPGVDDEVAIEELFFKRAAAKKPKVVSDEDYNSLSIEDRDKFHAAGHISQTQLFKLVDWLYFVRGLPLKGIAASLQVSIEEVASVKAEISNDFAKTLRKQNAESYIGDLLRIKELLRADIMFRKSKLSASDSAHGQFNKILWELENKFIDRLQEIGILDKTIGRLEVHEEWSVTIGPAGQPVNSKQRQLSEGEIVDIAAIQHTDSDEGNLLTDDSKSDQVLEAAAPKDSFNRESAFIKVK